MNLTGILLLCLILPSGKESHLSTQTTPRPYTSTGKDKLIPPDSLNGEVKKFYKSGKLKEVAFYEKGLLNGIRTTYSPNGNLNYEATYKAGELDGMFKHYDKGTIIKQIEYKNGLYDGLWTAFRKGRKVIEAQFSMGKLDGWYYDYYFKSGRIQRKAFYSRGVIISGEFLYGEDGYLKYEMICNHADNNLNHLVMQVFYDKQGKTIDRKKIDKFPVAKYLFGL